MLISELIAHLENSKNQYGDLPVEKEAGDEVEGSIIFETATRLLSKSEMDDMNNCIAIMMTNDCIEVNDENIRR